MSILKITNLLSKRTSYVNKCKLLHHVFYKEFNCKIYNPATMGTFPALTKHILSLHRKFHNKAFPSKTEETLKIGDAIPRDYELIYRAPLHAYVLTTHKAACIILVFMSAVVGYKYFNDDLTVKSYEIFDFIKFIETSEQLKVLLGIFFVVNLCLLIFTTKYPLRIYSNHHNSYIAIHTGLSPIHTKQVAFKTSDVMQVPSSGIMPWKECVFKIRNKNVIILQNYFKKPAYFHSMVQGK